MAAATMMAFISPPPPPPRHHGKLPGSFLRPSLIQLCVPVAAGHFLENPTFASLPPSLRALVVAELPLDLPLDLSAKLIAEDEYWERRARRKWENCDTSSHGCSWKQLFFERHVANTIESFDPTTGKEIELKRLLEISAPFVHNLHIYQLPSHMRASLIFEILGRELASLKLEYGWRNARMQYEPTRFGMKTSDCFSLANALSLCSTLTNLSLSCNLINDKKVGILVKGMLKNPIIIQLNLSYNRITNDGATYLSKLISTENSVLSGLNLAGNKIESNGAKSIAESLRNNEALISLSLRQNKISDDGGQAIFDALQSNSSLQRLGLGSCELGEETASMLGKLIRISKSGLMCLDISGNPSIGVKGGMLIQAGLIQEGSKTIKDIDLRLCEMGDELEKEIEKLIENKNKMDLIRTLEKQGFSD